MAETPSQRALTASTVSLLIAVGCIVMFIPPLVGRTTESVLRTVVVALVLAAAVLLHWIFLAIAARRLGRSVSGWVALAVLLFPVGSAASLILLGWFRQESEAPATAT